VTVRTRAQDKDRHGRCDIGGDSHFVDGRVRRGGRETDSQNRTAWKSAVHPVGADMPGAVRGLPFYNNQDHDGQDRIKRTSDRRIAYRAVDAGPKRPVVPARRTRLAFHHSVSAPGSARR
jgi:hypothetical protein